MGVHKVTETYGDDHLSSFERKLWDLTWYCMLKFGCPVMFNVFGPNAPRRIDQHIRFFVPTEHALCEQVREFLANELKSEEREGQDMEFPVEGFVYEGPNEIATKETGEIRKEYWYGTKVEILEYSGPNFYLEESVLQPIIKESCEKFMKMLEDRQLIKPRPH